MLIFKLIKNMFKAKKTEKNNETNKGICTLSSIEEASGLIDCIKLGLLPDTFERDPNGENGAFIDHLGNSWDVKTLKTHSIYGAKIFNLNNISRTIKKELEKPNKHLIINISKLPDCKTEKINKFLQSLPREQFNRIVILDCDNLL